MPPATIQENKSSNLLSFEENQQVFRLLGIRCQALATAIVQLFLTNAPHHAQWTKKNTGVLCFVKDNIRKNYFFRILCLKTNATVWEQEIYNNMEYVSQCPFLNSFEAENCMVAFNFASIEEAREMKSVVDHKLSIKRRREEKRARNSQNLDDYHVKSLTIETPYRTKITDPAVKKAKRRRNITKADIGNPQEFRHISHVGFDPNKGFEWNSDDIQLHDFFLKAGVSETQLRDSETRKFIYDFIAANGGTEAVLTEAKQQITKRPPPPIPSSNSGPPVPPRGTPRTAHTRAAPPPPPNCTVPSRPPPRTHASSISNIPLPPSGIAPPAPPPPPPPPPVIDTFDSPTFSEDVNIPPPPPNSLPPPQIDTRSALMESIRTGATLKPVADRKVESCDAREDLLSEIRKGFQLKPCTEREVKPVSPAFEGNDLAGALAKALAERNRVIHSEDDSTSDTESDNDDEWDA